MDLGLVLVTTSFLLFDRSHGCGAFLQVIGNLGTAPMIVHKAVPVAAESDGEWTISSYRGAP